jgi:hypothetical protein
MGVCIISGYNGDSSVANMITEESGREGEWIGEVMN